MRKEKMIEMKKERGIKMAKMNEGLKMKQRIKMTKMNEGRKKERGTVAEMMVRIKKEKGMTLVEMIVVLAVLGILLMFSLAGWTGLFERARLKHEIANLSTTIRRAYKDATSNGIYIVMELISISESTGRDKYLIYWEKNGKPGYQENEDEKINSYYLPAGIKFGSIEGFPDNRLIISPSGILKGEFNSSEFPGYAHAKLHSANLRATVRVSRIGELKTLW